jgi:myo-inositol-1(or 4)-monophosphatase
MESNRFFTDACDYLRDLLPRTGQIVRRYFHSEDLVSHKKGVHDFVTAADLSVNKFLEKELKKTYPKIPILTEERVPNDISSFKNAPLLWIIDPLDGTANFARGDSHFSICVALVQRGLTKTGVIFLPVSSRLYWATADNNHAYWNGRTIKVSSIRDLGKATVCTDWSHILDTRDATTDFLKKIYGHVRQIKILGSAATDITLLAKGSVDIYHHVRLFPWDTAAAAFIAQKAGAKVTDIKGNPWNAFSESIVAANPVLHNKLFKLLLEKDMIK